jgi:hypothetical protein
MSDTKKESLGTIRNQDGTTNEIVALFTTYRDDREVTICEAADGAIVVSTKSWLRQNNREMVETINIYTLETMAMMVETIMLGLEYFGVDIKKQMELLHASNGNQIKIEYAGKGEPDFGRKGDE